MNEPPSSSLAIHAPAICPHCGRDPERRSVRINKGVIVGDYRCNQSHIWETKWTVAA